MSGQTRTFAPFEKMNIKEWKDIPGYDGKYQANFNGQIRRVFKNKTKILAQYIKHDKYYSKMNYKEVNAAQCIWRSFYGDIPKEMSIIHKNGMKSDNCITNLKLVTRKELGIIYGPTSRRKGVAKIDDKCEIVEFYSSAREVGRKNHMSYQTVIDRCNGKCKSAFAPDGFAYAWEDEEVSMKHAMQKIELENGYMPKAREVVFDF